MAQTIKLWEGNHETQVSFPRPAPVSREIFISLDSCELVAQNFMRGSGGPGLTPRSSRDV